MLLVFLRVAHAVDTNDSVALSLSTLSLHIVRILAMMRGQTE